MTISAFLKNIVYNNEYYSKFELLTKQGEKDLSSSLHNKRELSDFSKEFGWYTNYSVLLLDSYSDTKKSFIAAHKTSNYIYKWTPLPKTAWKARVKVKPTDHVIFFYNQFGKPTKALTSTSLINEVGYNSYTRDYEKDTTPQAYNEELTLKDLDFVYSGYAQYLEIFDDAPFKNPELQNINFIFYGNSKILNKEQLILWAQLNGNPKITNKIDPTKQNVLVCLSDFPTTTKSILSSQIPVNFRYKKFPRISIKNFINIAYNINYKKGFVPKLDIIKAARYNEINNFQSWVRSTESKLLNKKTKQWLIDELDEIKTSLE